MEITVFTLFPEWFEAGPLGGSIIGRARERGILDLRIVDFRRWAPDRHRTVDAPPYGGGGGMVIMAEPLAAAMDESIGPPGTPDRPLTVLTSPRGESFCQETALEWARLPRLAFVCGHYEGVDERLARTRVDREVSLGDFVLTGGETAAIAMIDAVARLLPGALGNDSSSAHESFMEGLLEAGHYTRPPDWEGLAVPEVLRSGDHEAVRRWREEESLRLTRERRPDLYAELLVHPMQLRRLARRARPFVLFRRDLAGGPPEVLFATAGVRALPDFPGLLEGIHSEPGLGPEVRLAEVREAKELAPWGRGPLLEEVRAWLEWAARVPGGERPPGLRFVRNLQRELLARQDADGPSGATSGTAGRNFHGGNTT